MGKGKGQENQRDPSRARREVKVLVTGFGVCSFLLPVSCCSMLWVTASPIILMRLSFYLQKLKPAPFVKASELDFGHEILAVNKTV